LSVITITLAIQCYILVGAPDFRVPWLTGKQFPAVLMVMVLRVVL
jgi:hypothetical protein